MSNWDDLQQCLSPFKEAMAVALPSRDFAYSGGGIFPAIVGTLLLVVGAMAISIVLGVFCAIFLAEYGKSGKFLSMVRLAILNLAGVPSIIFGLFGFGLFVIFLDWNVSLLAGWFTLAFHGSPDCYHRKRGSLTVYPPGLPGKLAGTWSNQVDDDQDQRAALCDAWNSYFLYFGSGACSWRNRTNHVYRGLCKKIGASLGRTRALDRLFLSGSNGSPLPHLCCQR